MFGKLNPRKRTGMPRRIELVVLPSERGDKELLRIRAAAQAGIPIERLIHLEVIKVSLDARGRQPVYRIRADVYAQPERYVEEAPVLSGFRQVESGARVLVIGAGPGGYFAALELLEHGLIPVVLDRGKEVQARRRDLRAIQQEGVVNPHSNYCFGEGGAGTYSDGKLYTRSVKRGDVQKALRLLVEHGATADILTDAHPHIGSNKLPGVVQRIRASIEQYGGSVHFGAHVTDFILRGNRLLGVVTTDTGDGRTKEWLAEALILATGHSARDIYALLEARKIRVEAKPYALGVRVEHPQALIDTLQYRQGGRDADLPAASYSLVAQVGGSGVFSFCMCPGGLVVPAATSPGEIVVNGMSMSRRDSAYANSGVVTAVEARDWLVWNHRGPLAGLAFQQSVEQAMFAIGDGGQRGPAQRLTDFVEGRLSTSLPGSSYIPGLFSAPLQTLLPDFIYLRLREGLKQFGRQMRGYYTEEAVVIGTESRTSAPVRIPRDAEHLMHPEVVGLFPCGEGAGYAGGIISAAMDGQNVARAVARWLQKT
jgi:uncharacterized FAD-dependent dehydrogenase